MSFLYSNGSFTRSNTKHHSMDQINRVMNREVFWIGRTFVERCQCLATVCFCCVKVYRTEDFSVKWQDLSLFFVTLTSRKKKTQKMVRDWLFIAAVTNMITGSPLYYLNTICIHCISLISDWTFIFFLMKLPFQPLWWSFVVFQYDCRHIVL